MDKTKIDLNAPAFGAGAQKPEDLAEKPAPEVAPASVPQTEEKVEVKEEEKVEPSAEEQRVPYSRFKNVHQRAIEAERVAEEWRVKAEALVPQQQQRTESAAGDPPATWLRLYGDSPESREAWQIQQEQNEALKQAAREEAIKAVREERNEEQNRAKENLGQLDNHLELVSAAAGRDLTEKEESAILDIIDDYTPKDNDGNYLGALLPADKAWEIYELKNQASKAPKIESRNAVASLTGSQTEGEPSAIAERNKNFDPRNWNAYKDRL